MASQADKPRLSPAAAEREANPQSLSELAVLRRAQQISAGGITSMEDFWFAQGWYKEDARTGALRLTRANWLDNPELQIQAIVTLVGIIQKDPRDMGVDDFKANRLGGLMVSYFNDSPFEAISQAFPKLEIKPWEMITTSRGFFDSKENRVAAVEWLVEKTGKDPKSLIVADFVSNRLTGLIEIYGGRPFLAVSETFPELNLRPWEMTNSPIGSFSSVENRVAATKWLVDLLQIDPRDIRTLDFDEKGLWGLLDHHNGSPYAAISEAFPELDIKPWEMATTPAGFFSSLENRIAATRWLVDKLEKDVRDLAQQDFNLNRLRGLLGQYGYRPYAAISEAFPELDIKPWEMKITPKIFNSQEVRIAATIWLVDKTAKDPRDLTAKDFNDNGLKGLLNQYNGSPYAAVSEAFPELGINPWEMAITPQGFYHSAENRAAATNWLADKLRKEPEELTPRDFRENGLRGLLR